MLINQMYPIQHYYPRYPNYPYPHLPWVVPTPRPNTGRCPTCGKCLTCGSGHYCPGPYRPVYPGWTITYNNETTVNSQVS